MITENIERRTLLTHELRAAEEGGRRILSGYAARFNALSEVLGNFREEIAPGAFSSVLDGDVRALFNHDPSMVLGRTTNDTLTLSEDDRGLLMTVELPETRYADDLWQLVQRGDVNQMSFSFMVGETGQVWRKEGGMPIRRITKVARLLDVSAVTYPAYPQTSLEARTRADAITAEPPQDEEVNGPTPANDTPGAQLPTQRAQRARMLRLLSIKGI